jgi:putative nucleotidyltransferase with HDIG domain
MSVEATFMRSKLGRRILWLFVICALTPISVFTAVSLWTVSHELREENREALRQVSHEEGMGVYERLTFLEADLKLIASGINVSTTPPSLATALPEDLKFRFQGLELRSANGARKILFGSVSSRLEMSPAELAHLRSGNTLIATRECGDSAPCAYIVRQVNPGEPPRAFLIGEILIPYLADAENLAPGKDVCLLDDAGRTLLCSGPSPSFPSTIAHSASGRFSWSRDGKKYDADYWNLFLKAAFLTDHWTIVATEASENALLPLVYFKKMFLLAVLLSLLIVVFLALVQIRRNLVPLGELQRGTRQIAGGDFAARVVIQSGDEFDDLAQSFNSMARRIEKQFNALTTGNAIDRAVLSSWDIQRIISALLAHLHSIVNYKIACVSLLEPGDPVSARNYLASPESDCEKAPQEVILSEPEIKGLLAHPEINILPISDRCPQFLSSLASRGMRFFLVAPVVVAGRLSAIISLGHDESAVWTEEDTFQVRQIADQVGVALSNAYLVADLQDLNLGTLTALARAVDAKSPWTAGHSERVTAMALNIAREMGLSQRELDILHRGGLLHDVGKIGVPGDILDKPGKLTEGELSQIREHINIGQRILEPIASFAECMPVVLQHHEWFDGSGYPRGLAGEDISLHARIFAVADCYDALISDRPYRAGLPLERVLEILRQGTGKQFDPAVMEAFLRVMASEPKIAEREPAATRILTTI